MNKENKTLNIALRCCIILTWIMSNVNLFMIMSGIKNIEVEGLNKDNVVERLLKVLGDFAQNTTFYYVTFGMLIVCLILGIITRYKTTLVSFVFKLLALGLAAISMISGFTYVGALGSCKGLNGLTITATDKDSIAAALSSAGFTGNAADTADTLCNSDEAAAAIAGYMMPIIILFILVITSIHCLVKRKDPNNKESNGDYMN
ncbi:MAG: hypothetical protein IKN17_08930 [Ruminococcus sp.]|nr:hypothetical protein [Ruminococcus sp.]